MAAVPLVTAASSFPRVSSARVEANLGQAVGASEDIGYRSSPFSSHGNLGKTSMSDIVQNVSWFPCILVQEFSVITISIVKDDVEFRAFYNTKMNLCAVSMVSGLI
jgi:hypothetical protein